jgi:hypothetical protein
MRNQLIVHSLFAVAALTFAVSCGEKAVQLKAMVNENSVVSFRAEKMSFGQGTSASDSVRAEVSDPKISFLTSVEVPSDPLGSGRRRAPLVRITIEGPTGSVVETRTREGEAIEWKFDLRSGDGNYLIRGEIGQMVGAEFRPSTVSWERTLRLDTSPPEVVASATMNSSVTDGTRSVVLRVAVADLSAVSCSGQIEPGVQVQADAIPVALSADAAVPAETSSEAVGKRRFVSQEIRIPDNYPNRVITRVVCRDSLQHENSSIEAAFFEQPKFVHHAVIDAVKGIPFEAMGGPAPESAYLLRGGTAPDELATRVRVLSTLLDQISLTPVPALVVAREKFRLQVYLTDYEITDVAQATTVPVGKNIYMRRVFDLALDGAIPSSIVGSKRLYVTLTQIRDADGIETLVGSRPVDVYVEPNGARWSYSWMTGSQFVPAASNALISLQAQIRPATGTGTLLNGNPKVEYSTDNSSWTEIPVSDWAPVSGVADQYTFSIRYPFADERPFRVRLKGVSMAGNVSVSGNSRNLVAPPGFVTGGATCPSGSGVRAQLASSFLCRREELGVKRFFYVTTFESMGPLPLSFTANADKPCGSDYCFNLMQESGQGTMNRWVKADPLRTAAFRDHAREIYYLGQFSAEEFGAIGAFKATFALNNQTCAATPPFFFVENASLSPFACDE